MAIHDNQVLEDRYGPMEGGMNSSPVYSALPKNQSSLLVNLTCRNGFPQTRPGFKKWPLVFDSEETEDSWNTGKFQGVHEYRGGTFPMLIASIGGRIYRIRLDNYSVSDITIAGDPNPSIRKIAYMEQAESWLVVQDGQSAALIFDGASLRRASLALQEVPTGTAMAYGMGRLWVAVRGNQFVASDIVGGPSGTAIYNFRDAVLRFTENSFIAGGGAFSVPLLSGVITAMKFVANLNTALGQGALMVFTADAVFSVNPPVDRTQWQSMTSPIQTIAQINYGSVSPIITTVNGDLFYRSLDGIRSLIIGVRYFDQWANVPISVEMTNPLDDDSPNLTPFAHSLLFDNRLLMSTHPKKARRGVVFQGFVALDFNLISSLRGNSPPAYDGIWTGLLSLGMVKSRDTLERAFIFNANASDEIELWEMTLDERFDDGSTPITSIMEGPGLNFGNDTEMKKLQYGDLWIDKLHGNVNFAIAYRPDYFPNWVPWTTFNKCATYQDCTVSPCKTFSQANDQYRPRIRFPTPADDCEPSTNKPLRDFYTMQTRIQMTGACRILRCRMFARVLQEAAEGECQPEEVCTSESDCISDPFAYSSST